MPKVKVYDMTGKDVGEMELSEGIFGITPNASLLHAAVVHYLANQRQGNQSTKTRAEVRGGGRKPWRQKGTGRARQGSIRSPQWVGGGVALGPKPRSYRVSMNKKMKQIAIKSAFSTKVAEEKLVVIESITAEAYKTKTMVAMLEALKTGRSTMIVLSEGNEHVVRSARNIPNVKTASVGALNVYDLMRYDTVIMDKGSIEKLEEVYA